MNAYEMLTLLRDNVGEAVEKHWTDLQLLRRLNAAHSRVYTKVANAPGDWLLKKSDSITPSSSQLSLPSDCLFPVYVEEVTSGFEIPIRGTVRERRGGRQVGTSLYTGTVEAFLIGNKIEVNQDSYANACYIWYQPRLVELHAGVCGSSTDATHVHFEAAHWPSGTDDYYNGIVVEVRDVSNHLLNVSTAITDYVGSTQLATVASVVATPAAGDFYGTISTLPLEFHPWVIAITTVEALARPSSTFEKEIFGFAKSNLRDLEDDMESLLATRLSGSTYVREMESD
jgi:hypothetical protein